MMHNVFMMYYLFMMHQFVYFWTLFLRSIAHPPQISQ